ncbi:galactosyl transferase GMA12/MNN10 family-domain-containing protein [Elsinoe ampelina]|uniref:Galactosyl transferase GMA12/MNN10 family-domain-containing protein n=1 Tax=Elsinoe ampelina TaxID=302913 RepID=A0A6A6GR32_9PEZI|nr:galactosyl transferase GMA12/MNN10 family-domain-containing protein [Elsinoe ampelina]
MHFAYPGRKASPPPYPVKQSHSTFAQLRRGNGWRPVTVAVIGGMGMLYLLWRLLSGGGGVYVPAGTPKAVVVTMFDADSSVAWRESIMDNRRDYASRHGYATFFTNTTSYALGPPSTPKSWSILPSLRHAMTTFPHTPYFFYLAPSALIMTPSLSLESHILAPSRLESIMLTDRSVVPPDSVIKTFSHLKGGNIDFVLTQDEKGLSRDSMIIRSGEWAKYLLDAWFDPLYRSYNFQKAERHALEHIVQWHGTILSKLALIPQRTMNSYMAPSSTSASSPASKEGQYSEGDFIANFEGCEKRSVPQQMSEAERKKKKLPPAKTENLCEKEMERLLGRWREMVDREGRH